MEAKTHSVVRISKNSSDLSAKCCGRTFTINCADETIKTINRAKPKNSLNWDVSTIAKSGTRARCRIGYEYARA